MSDAMYGFATGFADSFTRAYSARLANEAQQDRADDADQKARERDKLRYGLDVWSKGVTAYEQRKADDTARQSTAADIIASSNIPQDATSRVMDLLSMDYSAKDIIQMNVDGRLTFSKPEIQEVEDPTKTPEPVVAEEDTQTDDMLVEMAESALESDALATNDTVADPEGDSKEDITPTLDTGADVGSQSPMSQIGSITGLREMLGVDDDYFNSVIAGYQSAPSTYNYDMKISPEVKAATSFEQAALQAAMADEKWDEENPIGNVTIMAEYKAKLSPKTSAADNPKEAAMLILTATDGFKALQASTKPEDQEKAIQMLADLDAQFDAKSGNMTYTQGNYVSDIARFTKMLSSDNPEEVATAKAWFETEKPALDAGFEAIGALTRAGDAPTYNVMYTNSDGNQLQGLAEKITTPGEDGVDKVSYKFADGTVRTGTNIISVVDEETAQRRQSAVQAASTEYKVVAELQSSVVPAVHQLRELDKLALQNEVILSTTGAGISLFERFGTEFNNLMALAGQGETNGEVTRETLLSQINDDYNSMIGGNWRGAGKIDKSDAEAYKEFSAAMVRAIFNTGRALGQQGNGFSNKDYAVIAGSIQASNSYPAFSRNLRRFSGELLMSWNTTAKRVSGNPVVKAALTYPGARDMIRTNLLTPQEWYKEMTPEYASDLDWASNTVTSNRRIIQSATDDEISTFNLPQNLKGKRVVLFFGDDQGGQSNIYYEEF
jgi:hypothetical protein